MEKGYCEMFDILEKFLRKTYLFFIKSDRFGVFASQDFWIISKQ